MLQFLDGVIEVKNGRKQVSYLTPELKPILGKTYGAIVYQEEVMEIFQKLAGYTLGQADNVRRYMSKKKADKLAHEEEAFIHGDPERGIKGCVANGINENAAKELFKQMTDFARYAFNKSHAAAYAANSYYTAWLKYYYPSEFLAAALNWADKKKIPGLINDARELGINVLVPSINYSDINFSVTSDGSIRYGMSAVKDVGEEAEKILAERKECGKFDSIYDFFVRCNVNKQAVEALINAGGFDDFGYSRAAMLEAVAVYKGIQGKMQSKRREESCYKRMLPFVDFISTTEELLAKQESLGVTKALKKPLTSAALDKKIHTVENAILNLDMQMQNVVVPVDIIDDKDKKMKLEHEALGAYVTANPVDNYTCRPDENACRVGDLTLISDKLLGVISSMEVKKTKSTGKPYASLIIEDRTGSIHATVSARAYQACGGMLEEGSVLVFSGSVKVEETDDDEAEEVKTFFVSSVSPAVRVKDGFIWPMSRVKFEKFKNRLDVFKAKYEDLSEDGYPLYLQYLDQKGDTQLFEIPFMVSASVGDLDERIKLMK